MSHIVTSTETGKGFTLTGAAKLDELMYGGLSDKKAAIERESGSLTRIFDDEINLAVWQRSLYDSLISEASALIASDFSINQRRVLPVNGFSSALLEMAPALETYPELCRDMLLLSEMFSCLFELEAIGFRLATLEGAMCPKFHVDYVPCRLITTYTGMATQWLPEHRVDRNVLAEVRSSRDRQSQKAFYRSETDIQQLSAGDVALLKGERWEGNEGAGVVHRSPASTSGQRRLLVTMDFA